MVTRPTLNEGVWFGTYQCQRCGDDYTVNDPKSFRLCTAEFCHEHLNKQSALLPYPEPKH